MMRAADCPCGEYLEARNDSELLEAAKGQTETGHDTEHPQAELRRPIYTAYGVQPAG